MIEYTWNELENEKIRIAINGKKLISLSGPEKIDNTDLYWTPALDEDGNPYDLYWEQSESFCDAEFFSFVSFEPSDILNDEGKNNIAA